MIKHSLNIIFLIIIFGLMCFIFVTSTKINKAKQHLETSKQKLAHEKENNQILIAEWAYLTSPRILAEARTMDRMMLESINFWQVKNIDGLKSSSSLSVSSIKPSETYKIYSKPKTIAITSAYKNRLQNIVKKKGKHKVGVKIRKPDYEDNNQEYKVKTNTNNILLSKF